MDIRKWSCAEFSSSSLPRQLKLDYFRSPLQRAEEIEYGYQIRPIWEWTSLANRDPWEACNQPCDLSRSSQLLGRYHTCISIRVNIMRGRFSMTVLPYRNTRKMSTCHTVAEMLPSYRTHDIFWYHWALLRTVGPGRSTPSFLCALISCLSLIRLLILVFILVINYSLTSSFFSFLELKPYLY